MRLWSSLLLLMALTVAAAHAQELPLALDPDSPEGRLILEIGEQDDEAKKMKLLEDFASKFGQHEGAAWVYQQLQPMYVKLNQLDRALEIGEKLIAISPESVEAAYHCLRAAESKKDFDLIKKWAILTWTVSKKVATSDKPRFEEDPDLFKERVEYAKSVHSYAEYALYAAAVAAPDAKKRIELLQELEQRNPRSSYLSQVHSQYYAAFRQLGNLDQSVSLAEKNFNDGKADEDMLTLLTVHFHQRKDTQKTLFYASKLVELMATKTAPAGLKPEDWDRKKTLALGNAHYLTGVIYSEQDRFTEADRHLRAALPFLKYDEYIRASALFHIGWANYKLGERAQSPSLIKEAIRYSQQCATIPGPFRAQALKNVEAMKVEYDIP